MRRKCKVEVCSFIKEQSQLLLQNDTTCYLSKADPSHLSKADLQSKSFHHSSEELVG